MKTNFQENRLLFMTPPRAELPGAPTRTGEKPVESGTTPPPPEKLNDEQLKTKMQEIIGKLETAAQPVNENKDGKYTAGTVEGAKKILASVAEIKAIIADPKALEKKANFEKIKKALPKFEEEIKNYEVAKLAADETLQTSLKAARESIKTKKAELTEDAILKAAKIPEAEMAAKKAEYKVKEKIDAIFAKLDADLQDDPNATPERIKAKIDKANAEIAKLTVEAFAKPIENNENQKTLTKKVYDTMEAANGEKTLDFKLEEMEKVLGLYELGQYENPTEKAKAKKIMAALKEHGVVLKAKGLDISFLGGTDGNDHKEIYDKKYHDNKKAAFEGLMAFNAAGKLPSGLLDPTKIASIEAYNAAVTAGKVKEFFTTDANAEAHKNAFRPGTALFDLALAYQRAEDRKKLFTDDKNAKLNPKEDTLVLELGTTKTLENDERKSGIVFIETKVEEKEKKPPEIKYEIKDDKKTLTITPPPPPPVDNKPPPPPTPIIYELTRIPTTTHELKRLDDGTPGVKINDNTTVPIPLDKDGLPVNGEDSERKYRFEITPQKGTIFGVIKILEIKKTPDHSYKVEGKKVSITFSGETAPKDFDLDLPDGAKVEAVDKGGDQYVQVTIGDAVAIFEFDRTEKWRFKIDGPQEAGKKDLMETHKITLDDKGIHIIAKTAKDKPQDKEHPNDTENQKADRAYYKTKNIPYMTREEAIMEGHIEDKGGDVGVKDGYVWVVSDNDAKSEHENRSNYAVKAKPKPAAEDPDDDAADEPGDDPVDPETKPQEYAYKLDGNKLSFVGKSGTSLTYTIAAPKGATLNLVDNEGDKYVIVGLNGSQASIEFDPENGEFSSSKIEGIANLNATHDITCDTTTHIISITSKETPAQTAERSKNEKVGITYKTRDEAQAELIIGKDKNPHPKPGFIWVDPTSKTNYATEKKENPTETNVTARLGKFSKKAGFASVTLNDDKSKYEWDKIDGNFREIVKAFNKLTTTEQKWLSDNKVALRLHDQSWNDSYTSPDGYHESGGKKWISIDPTDKEDDIWDDIHMAIEGKTKQNKPLPVPPRAA